jgi:hypothetical protein
MYGSMRKRIKKITVRKSEEKKPLAIPKHMWKGNIKMLINK